MADEQVQTQGQGQESDEAANNANPGGTQGDSNLLQFTQEQFDQKMGERAQRAQESAINKLLSDLGVENADALKSVITAHREREDAEKSDLEKAQSEVAQLQSQIEQMQTQTREQQIRSAFVAEAAKVGAKFPEDAYNLADRSAVSIADGKVTGVTDAVKALVESGRLPTGERPTPPDLDGGAGNREKPAGAKGLTMEELEVAKKMRIKPEDYAKFKNK